MKTTLLTLLKTVELEEYRLLHVSATENNNITAGYVNCRFYLSHSNAGITELF